MNPAVAAELKRLDDGIPFRASRNYAHHTWARTFHSSPELYIRPQSVEEVQKAITLARRCRKRITTVGCGHSPSDMTCTSSWMVNLDDFAQILSVNKEKGVVVMQAGIRLWQLGEELDKVGLAMPNLGSINDQSIAGAISTGTHGSTLRHSVLSSSVLSLRITLSNSRTVFCSPEQNRDLFRAALLSLGSLGIITEITFQAVPAFTLHWQQAIYPDKHIFSTWEGDLWKQAEFVRVWWFPYTRRATIWHADKTERSPEELPFQQGYYDAALGYHVYHNLLALAHYVPSILPFVEWFVFGMQYGFSSGPQTKIEAIQPSRKALLMNCLYSQYVNEWAIPLHLGPIAIRRLSSWLNQLAPSDPDFVEHGIPYSAKGLYVHAPVEVRVSDTTLQLKTNSGEPRDSARPFLDSTCDDGPTLYLNATLYRPYDMDPPCRERYYQGFEYLMRELGGKPHWAKNFDSTSEEIERMYAGKLDEFRKVRTEADPEGLFAGPWHRRYILGTAEEFDLEETEVARTANAKGGLNISGKLGNLEREKKEKKTVEEKVETVTYVEKAAVVADLDAEGEGEIDADLASVSGQSKSSSVSSFDILHGGEAVESQVLMPQFRPNA
jgi:D-arabinono-1,4-lactone oxidase